MSINLDLNSRINFGKYKGRLVSDILKLDPDYLKWAYHDKKIINPSEILKQRLRENNMKIKQLREAIRQIIRKELNENQPAPSKPERETTTVPARPGTKEKPDEKRRKIGRPDIKPAPKNLKEEEMVDKIVKRFTKAKMKNESAGGTLDFVSGKIEKPTPKEDEVYLKDLKPGDKFKPSKSDLEYIVVTSENGIRGVGVKHADGTGNMNFRGDAVVKKIK
jgi:hypothetical protein